MTAELDRFETLVSEYLDGELDAAQRAELAALVERDPGKLQTLVEHYRQARALTAALTPAAEAEFAKRVLRELQRDRTPFSAGVMRDIRRWRRRRVLVSFTLSAAAALALATGFLRWRTPGAPSGLAVLETTATGVLVVRGGRELSAGSGFELRSGDALRTSGEAGVRITYRGEPTSIDVEPWSELSLGVGNAGKWIELVRGEVHAEVAPQPPGRPLVIHGLHARAEVLGTRLVLSAVPDATRLEVEDGRVRLVRDADGAAVEVLARHFIMADGDSRLVAEPVRAAPAAGAVPAVVGFSLITADRPRDPLAGFEELRDGAVIDLARLPTRRINVRARTAPALVGSVRFAAQGFSNYNTEINEPYTLVPGTGRGEPGWLPTPGRYTITATPFGGSYGNGARGAPASITVEVVDSGSR